MLALPASTEVLLSWKPTSDKELTRIRAEIFRLIRGLQTARRDPVDHFGDDVAQAMGLVATELVGNALRHGQPPVGVRLLRDDHCFFLDVSDCAVHSVPMAARADPGFHVGGRGLQISLSVAQQVCWYATETTKHVWASFPRVGSPAAG
jgi:serine/threonine-protein kinase RsbW